MNSIKTVGVLGGMGPAATIDYMGLVLEMTPANCDQQHIPMIVYNNTQVPERAASILRGEGDSGRVLVDMARRLALMPVDFLVMPCNTAHFYEREIRSAVDIPFVSIIDVTIDAVLRSGVARVGLLATDACLAGGMYQTGFAARDLDCRTPTGDSQKRLMEVISRVKEGDRGQKVCEMARGCCAELVSAGAELLIAGCTEIPLVVDQTGLSAALVSSTQELAKATVARALGSSLPGT